MTFSKHAGAREFFKGIFEHGKTVAKDPFFQASAALPVIGAAVGGIGSAVSSMADARAKSKSYQEMLDLHPRMQKYDPKMVSRVFSSIHRLNPTVAKDPLLAGAFVDRVMETHGHYEGGGNMALAEVAKDLAQLRSGISQATSREPAGIGSTLSRTIKEVGGAGVARAAKIDELHGVEADRKAERQVRAYEKVYSGLKSLADRGHPIDPDVISGMVEDAIYG